MAKTARVAVMVLRAQQVRQGKRETLEHLDRVAVTVRVASQAKMVSREPPVPKANTEKTGVRATLGLQAREAWTWAM